jgi:hypothetical protein
LIFLIKKKGEQKMGTTRTDHFNGDSINGALYYRDDDGNFVKMMTVTDIETVTTSGDERFDVKVDGYSYATTRPEKVKVNNTDSNTDRRMLGSISEKYSLEDHVYFMIFDGTDWSVKIDRNITSRYQRMNYNSPYRVTVSEAGTILWTRTYHTWRDLECTFLYEVSAALNADFSPMTSITTYGCDRITRMLTDARRVVKFNQDRTPEEMDKAVMKIFLNQMYGKARMDDAPMNVSTNIDKVIFDDPATVILWKDGTKTVVHAQDGEPYDKEKGFAMAVCKKIFGNDRDYYHVFKRWFRKGEDRSIKRLIEKLGNNGEEEETE